MESDRSKVELMLFCFKESTAIGYRHCGFISFWIPWLGCTQCWVALRLSLPSILFVIPFRSLHVRRHWRWAETWGLWEGKFHPDDRFWCLHSSSRGKAAVPPCNCQPPHCQWPSLDLTQLFFCGCSSALPGPTEPFPSSSWTTLLSHVTWLSSTSLGCSARMPWIIFLTGISSSWSWWMLWLLN